VPAVLDDIEVHASASGGIDEGEERKMGGRREEAQHPLPREAVAREDGAGGPALLRSQAAEVHATLEELPQQEGERRFETLGAADEEDGSLQGATDTSFWETATSWSGGERDAQGSFTTIAERCGRWGDGTLGAGTTAAKQWSEPVGESAQPELEGAAHWPVADRVPHKEPSVRRTSGMTVKHGHTPATQAAGAFVPGSPIEATHAPAAPQTGGFPPPPPSCADPPLGIPPCAPSGGVSDRFAGGNFHGSRRRRTRDNLQEFPWPSTCRQALRIREQCNREAFLRMSGLKDEHLIFNASSNRAGQSAPYYVAVDQEQSSIVIAIRGSLRCALCEELPHGPVFFERSFCWVLHPKNGIVAPVMQGKKQCTTQVETVETVTRGTACRPHTPRWSWPWWVQYSTLLGLLPTEQNHMSTCCLPAST
jgi:hypothetical protein